MTRLTAVAGRQDAHQQVPVLLVAGWGGLGGPDRVQDGQVVCVGQGLVAGLGGRALLAVAVQHAGQRCARRGGPGGRGTNAVSFGMNLVIAGQLGSRTRAGHRVGPVRGRGEHVGEVEGLGQHACLPGLGGRVDHRYEPAVGQHRPRGSGLVRAQPRLSARRVRVLPTAGQCLFQRGGVGAERVRGLRAVHARRAARAGLRDHALFHGQLRAGGVAHAAVPLVDAAPVGAQQAGRDLRRLGRLQADDGLEL